jgi:hypothetical protein
VALVLGIVGIALGLAGLSDCATQFRDSINR